LDSIGGTMTYFYNKENETYIFVGENETAIFTSECKEGRYLKFLDWLSDGNIVAEWPEE
jgi:hypothetical protein